MLQQQTKVFFPNLDGLRFIAFFAVFLNHSFIALDHRNTNDYFLFLRDRVFFSGDLGVSLFFVLSGFLITYLLLKEKELYGRINIPHFYFRRILRIWPVYFLVVALCLFVFPLFHGYIDDSFPIAVKTDHLNPWLYAAFLGNFDYLYHGITNVLIGVLWSVSVEEQFYLFWPLLVAFLPKKYLLPSFIAVIMAAIAFRFFGSNGGNAMLLKYHSLSCMSDLATGAVLAYLCTLQPFLDKIKNTPRWLIILSYLIFFILVPFRGFIWKFGANYVLVASVLPVIFSSLFAFFIMEQNHAERSFYKLSRFRLISALGKYTYGMYCYHMLIFFLVVYLICASGMNINYIGTWQFFAEAVLSLGLTILISRLSYRYYEQLFLKLKEKFAHITK